MSEIKYNQMIVHKKIQSNEKEIVKKEENLSKT